MQDVDAIFNDLVFAHCDGAFHVGFSTAFKPGNISQCDDALR